MKGRSLVFLLCLSVVAIGADPQSPTKLSPAFRMNPAKCRASDPLWQYARHEIYASQSDLENSKAALSTAQLQKFVMHRGSVGGKQIALTFDDGPHPAYTPKLLAILKAAKVKATFFVIGHMAQTCPDLVKRIAREGHEVANHTFSHVTLTNLSERDVATEYKANNLILTRLTGKRVRYCRPPGGDFDLHVLKAAARLNLTTVLWTDDPGDYANPGDSILLRREIQRLSDGGIILLHDGSINTIDTLAEFIAEARRQGFKFVSLDALREKR